MTAKQLQNVMKIIEKERKRELRDQLAINWIAAHGEGDAVQKLVRSE